MNSEGLYEEWETVKNPNNYWQNPDGTYGLFFSVDVYPLDSTMTPFKLPGLQ